MPKIAIDQNKLFPLKSYFMGTTASREADNTLKVSQM